jgi:hypothetical protein
MLKTLTALVVAVIAASAIFAYAAVAARAADAILAPIAQTAAPDCAEDDGNRARARFARALINLGNDNLRNGYYAKALVNYSQARGAMAKLCVKDLPDRARLVGVLNRNAMLAVALKNAASRNAGTARRGLIKPLFRRATF